MCYPIQRGLQSSKFFMLGSAPLHVLCPTNIPGESQGYRDMPEPSSAKALSHRLSWSNLKVNPIICQRDTGLPNLSGLWSYSHQNSVQIIPRRRNRSGYKAGSVCFRFYYHRTLPVNIPMGNVQKNQIGCQNAYPSKSSWSNPNFCGHNSWQDPRCNYNGRHARRSKFNLYFGQGLSRFSETLSYTFNIGFLRNQSKGQSAVSPFVFKQSRQNNWRSDRSSHHACGTQIKNGLSR